MRTYVSCPQCKTKHYHFVSPVIFGYALWVCENWHWTWRITLRF